VRAANDGLRFLLELSALVAVAIWGYDLTDGPLRWLLAIAAPLAVAVVWGRWLAPRSPRRLLDDPRRLALEVAVFGAAAAALVASGHTWSGVVLAAAAAVHLALTFPLGQRGS
jgi:uncharacterized protein DUF2568